MVCEFECVCVCAFYNYQKLVFNVEFRVIMLMLVQTL